MKYDLDILHDTIRMLCRNEKFQEARKFCEDYYVLAVNDEDRAAILGRRAYIERAAGDISSSISYLQKAKKLDPRSRAILAALMIDLIALKNFNEARNTCISLIELDKQFPYQSFTSSAYFHLAYCCWHLGLFEDARAALNECGDEGPIWIAGGLLSKAELMYLVENRMLPDNTID